MYLHKISKQLKINQLNRATALLFLSLMPMVSFAISDNQIQTNTHYNQLSFSTSVEKNAINDEISASLYQKYENKDTLALANSINLTLNKVMSLAKNYPNVFVSTGQQHTAPQYDKYNNINGWTGRASIKIKSTDLIAASKLIAELQSMMVVDHINFGVSDDKQKQLEETLMIEASKSFQTKATTLSRAWGAKDYKLVNVSLKSDNSYQAEFYEASSKMSLSSNSRQDFESGTSKIGVTAFGTIEIVK